jgi:hypothetical protein
MPGGMRGGVIFSLAIPGRAGDLPLAGRDPFKLPVFAGIIGGGGIAGLRLAAGGLVLTIVFGFRIFAPLFEFTLALLAPEQPAMTAAIAVVANTVRYLIFFVALRLFSLP